MLELQMKGGAQMMAHSNTIQNAELPIIKSKEEEKQRFRQVMSLIW